ncbi:hypothetical protein FG386_002695 [Cryptosporidium ryanae]|uniref:uncharacterized protein n=1 Tax=Cryptosporidium ryanae TaxID=515981 RepID=UPI00351A2F8F|nr:hypothetical protein FG386_002695 [Cryptosporidium ryanae]
MKNNDVSSSSTSCFENKESSEEILSKLLRIVEFNPSNDAILETIKTSGIQLEKVKDLLAKQHPELKNLYRDNNGIKPSLAQKTDDNQNKLSKIQKNNGVLISLEEDLKQEKTKASVESKNHSIKGRPPGPPPPLKSKANDAKIDTTEEISSIVSNKATLKRGAPPKGPPPLKPSLIRGKTCIGLAGNSTGSDSDINNSKIKVSELDFGPTPPLGFEPKRLHWSVIPPNKIFGTIWEDIHLSKSENLKKENIFDLQVTQVEEGDNELKFDIDSILDHFFENKTLLMGKLNIECTSLNSNNSSKKYKMVLDSKRSQNIEIALKAMQLFDNNNELDISPIKEMLGYTRDSLKYGIDSFLKGVSKERLKILLDLYPTPDEIQLLNTISDEYNVDNLPLRSSEYFLKSILNLNRFKTRAQCVLSMKTFEEEYLSCLERLIKLEDAAVHIRSSLEKGGVLRQILELILKIGNYLNHGTSRGKSCGFRFHSIELLKNVKSNNSKSNLLKYISKILYDHSDKTRQNIDVIYQACSEAAPIDIADVYRDIEELGKNIEFIQKEINQFSVGESSVIKNDDNTVNVDKCNSNYHHSKSLDINYLQPPKYMDFNNQLDIPVFEVDQIPEKTTNELYLEIVEKFVNKSSKQLEVIKKQLNEIINKLKELQKYTGETQSGPVSNNTSSKLSSNDNIEIIKRCDMFFRLIKYEFNEFQVIEKKKKDKEIRKLMASKSINKLDSNVKDKLLAKTTTIENSKNISDYSSINEMNNDVMLQSENMHNSNQLLLEVSNITITSNSSTLSSSDSSYFQENNKTKNNSGNNTPSDNNNSYIDIEQNNIKESQKYSNSMSLTLNSGYDPILNTIERYSMNFNSKLATGCDHCNDQIVNNTISTFFDQNTCFSLQQTGSTLPVKTVPVKSSSISNDNCNDLRCKSVINNNQPLHLRSFFDTSSATANIAARVYDSQTIQSSSRMRKPQG